MIKIRSVKKEDKEVLVKLFTQLTKGENNFDLEMILSDNSCRCIVLEDNDTVIGSATLSIYSSPVKGRVGVVEDVIVDKNYRGKGLGRSLMDELIKIGEKENLTYITLTSNPKREAARNLYQSLGFELYDTGFFKLNLKK
jgi:ribosomal protein S18 acetylase RimI-like enzyme